MAYDTDFYTAYAAYLVEPRVRAVHDKILQVVSASPAFRRVVDLGCGQGNEFFHYAKPDFYVGMDENAIPANEKNFKTVSANYRDIAAVSALAGKFNLTAAVSLFSTQITKPRAENQAYYEKLFQETKVEAILAPGFYYESARGQETITESGGVVSYQLFEDIDEPPTTAFDETRIALPCPSGFFGEDVMEVWRLLQRAQIEGYDPDLDKRFAALAPNATTIRLAR